MSRAAKPKIDKALIERWLAALRSGEYRQGGGVLRRGDKFCCYGVLCDLVDSSRWKVYDNMNEDNVTYCYEDVSSFPRVHWLPQEIDEPLGRPSMIRTLDAAYRLSDANDRGTPFPDIADAIEAHYKKIGVLT